MTAYLLSMIICSGYFILIYVLLLERQKMHRFNRIYLLSSLAISLILPALHFEIESEVGSPEEFIYSLNENLSGSIANQPVLRETNNGSPQLLLVAYLLITLIFLTRFLRNLYEISRLIKTSNAIDADGARLILTPEPVFTHSFLNYIFINKKKFERGEVEKEIITHELTHVRQKHTLDILLIEFLKTLIWFNPFIYFYKRAIQLNHEFLADDAVIVSHGNAYAYQQLLLAEAMKPAASCITSSFHYLITKKRLTMMSKSTSKIIVFARQFALLPLFAVAVFCICIELAAQDSTKPAIISAETLFGKSGATDDIVKQYEDLVNWYKSPGKEWWKGFEKLTPTDRKKMETIFFQMSKEQKNKQIVAFRRPIAPSKRAVPNKSHIEKWKNSKMYGVWLDGKRIKNSVLENYTPTDFGHYSESRLYPTAINYGKHYVQVNLMTNDFYQDYYDKAIADSANIILFKGFNANWKFRF